MMKRERDAEAELNLPPGFRFHPTDEELVVHYLCRKVTYQGLPVPIIAEVDLYKYDPWQLPEKALFGTKEWYFFTPRDRKYPNGSRPNRAAGTGYWKATGADKPIKPYGSPRHVGIKKALVFYSGKAPKGIKSNWIMHEYRLAEPNRSSNKKGSLRLDDWVLCRIYNKKNNWQKIEMQKEEHSLEETEPSLEETMDSFETIKEFRTPESEVENDPFTELDDLVGPHSNPSQALDNNQVARIDLKSSFQMGEYVKVEDNDWFTDLNLDDFAVFGAKPVQDLAYQDYYFSSLCSPQFKPYLTNQSPF